MAIVDPYATPKRTPALGLGQAGAANPAEKFMGTAEQVPRPALSAPSAPAPSTVPTSGAANLYGSGSAPIGGTGGASTQTAPGALSRGLSAARGLVNGGVGKLVAGGAAAQAIGDSTADDSTARYAKRFGVSEPTGDGSLGDIAKFVGLRAGGFASDLGNRLTGGLAGHLYQDNPGTPTAAQAAPGAASAPAAVAAPTQPENLAGAPLYGAPGVRKVDGQNGTPLYTNATSNADDTAFQNSKGTVSTVGGGPEVLASLRRAGDLQAQISSMQAGLRDRGDINAYLGPASGQPGGVSADAQAQLARLARSNNRNVAVQAANATLANSTAQEGHYLTARTAANAARLSQFQNDRDFGLKQQEAGLREAQFGQARDQQDFTQRETAAKDLHTSYQSQFTTTDKDGKTVVDTARAAKFTNGVQTFLGNRQNELEQKVATGAATPAEAKTLADIKRKGVGALDQQDLAHIESLIKLGERSEQTAGLITGGRFVQSANPADYEVIGRKQNLIGSDTLLQRGGGTTREADTRYREPANTILPDFLKQRTTDFDLAKGLRK